MKKILVILITICSFFILGNNVSALYAGMTSDETRVEENNYGVNKKWNISESNLQNVLETPLVDSSKKIYDYSDILTDEEENELYLKMNSFIENYNMDIVILTASLPYSYDSYNEVVASDFYDYNDFGIDFSHYSGILLFRNTYLSDPYFDIYTFGDAQLYFNDYRYDELLDGIYDDLHNKYYLDGFKSFIDYCEKYILSGIPENLSDSYINDSDFSIVYGKSYNAMSKRSKYFIVCLTSGIVTCIFLGVNISKNKMVIKATNANDYLVKGSLNWIKKEDRFITSHVSKVRITSSTGGGGGHSSFGSSGGGHSSGGGRHG